jgi:hypothetical protein
MPEIRTITTLKRKRAEIAASIKLYEKQLTERSDLARVERQRLSRVVANLSLALFCQRGQYGLIGRDCSFEMSDTFVRRIAPRAITFSRT